MRKVKEFKHYTATVEQETQTILKNLPYDQLVEAADLIVAANDNGNRVHITGIGKPAHLAGYVASLYSSIGIPTYFLDGTETIHGSSGQVRKGDVVIAISNSGNTGELLKCLDTLRRVGAVIIGVSSNVDSKISEYCKFILQAKVEDEGDIINLPPLMSIIAEEITLQALAVLLEAKTGLTLKKYGTFHPGGSIGKKVNGIV